MGFYEHWIVPRLLDLAMRNRLLDRYREQAIETARGLVLEVRYNRDDLDLVLDPESDGGAH